MNNYKSYKKEEVVIMKKKMMAAVLTMAMAVAAALDAMEMNEIVGSIAGDDTIMCAVKGIDETIIVMAKIRKLINKKEG